MSRTRIVKGVYTKITKGNYNMYSAGDTNITALGKNNFKGDNNTVYGDNPEKAPDSPIGWKPEPELRGDVIFCNGYLSNPKKNSSSYLNVLFDTVPDDPLQKPYRGANMSEKKITDKNDILTNSELEMTNRKGGGTLYSDENFEKAEYVRWLFASKEKFEGYWEGYNNISKNRYSQVFKDYFHAQGNAHFINGSHGLQSSGAHRVEHGIAQGYAWAIEKWGLKNKKNIDNVKEKNPNALSYSPAYKPVTIVGHSQGAAIAAGVAIGVLYYAFEKGWEEAPINIIFLGTHQPQGLYEKSYEDFEKYYFEDYINDWLLEFVAEIFTKEKLKQNQGIYEKMTELLGDKTWKGLIDRAVQFTFPNDRALFVTRMGDIPGVKNACSKKDNIHIGSWFTSMTDKSDFTEDDGFWFPNRILDKAFNADGSINAGHPSYKQCVKEYWKVYQEYAKYKAYVKSNPLIEFEKAKGAIPDISILPSFLQNIIYKSIEKVYQTKQKAYLQSELYRKRVTALLAFVKVHEMELQAHFAPVGLMFNKGVLADWHEYQDQTIWDRIKETVKEIFYKVDYSNANLSREQKIQEDKQFIDGEGNLRMIATNIANTPQIKKWIDQAKEELKVEDNWVNNLVDWWNGDKEYDGSGWGHGARQEIANLIGVKDGDNINSLFGAGIYSMLQKGEVDISNSKRLTDKINKDDELIEREHLIARMVINDQRYLKKDFNLVFKHPVKGNGIQLGGKRAEGEMWQQFKEFYLPKNYDTWKVAFNELTWLLRSISLQSTVQVNTNGDITITHQFEDIFDLRPSDDGSRSYAYDMVSIITGFAYHDVAGGNDKIRIKGKWSNQYTSERVKFKEMTSEELIEYKKKQWNSAKEFIKNNPRYDSNKW